MGRLQKSTKILIILTIFTLISITIGLVGKSIEKSNNEEVSLEDVYNDSVATNDKSLLENVDGLSDEDKYTYLKEGVDIAMKTISPVDEETVIGRNILELTPELNEEPTLFISFDKRVENVEDVRETIITYAKNENSYPIKIVYMNVEYSALAGSNYYRVSSEIPEGDNYVVPNAFLIENNKVVWEEFSYENLPLRGEEL